MANLTSYLFLGINLTSYLFFELIFPVDNFGTVVGENPTPYGILALWAVNGLSIVHWVTSYQTGNDTPIYSHICGIKVLLFFPE